MKNNILNNTIYALLTVTLVSVDCAYSLPHLANPALKPAILKTLLAMGGVLVFSIMLYFFLSLHNKFFVASHFKDQKLYKDSLKTPEDREEAIMAFIIRNRLK